MIVTGAGRGIGLAIAEKLAGQGYDLALVDIAEDLVKAAAASLKGDGRYEAFTCDISNWAATMSVAEQVQETFSAVYGLVNNAGVTRDGLFVRMKPEDWQRVLDINLTGTFNFTRAISPIMMRQREGRIVSIASVIGIMGNAGQANYAASKAGVIAMTKSVAKELGGRSVTVNAVAPGFIATDMTAGLSDSVKNAMLQQIALKRFGEASDIAGLVSFLLSEDAAYITGQTLVCDGGMVF
ncbi:MAG: 3-oxoacyl-[acyl-carrier-protein] reductase [bacterium]